MNGRMKLVRTMAAVLMIAAAFTSCRLLQERKPPAALEAVAESPAAALAVNARFVRPDDKVPGFFKTMLADSGFSAVQVVLRNDGPRELWIHSANGMDLGPGFGGIRLVSGFDTLEPVHPANVAKALMGEKRTRRFRRPSTFGIVMSPAIPPLGVYVFYEEVSVGRFYRPLFSKSLYPALQSGLFEPVRLAPGAERSGWLFFDIAPGERDSLCEILVSACVPPAAGRKLPGYEFLFSHPALRGGGTIAGTPGAVAAPGEGYLFSLSREKKASGLNCWKVEDLSSDPVPPPRRLETVSTKSAELADADHSANRAAVAVNFKTKSRAIAMTGEAGAAVSISRSVQRPLRRVFVLDDRICAITDNGYLRVFDAQSRPSGNGMSLAREFEDATLVGDTLYAYSRERGIDVYATASDIAGFVGQGRFAVPLGDRRFVGASDGALLLLDRGKRTAPDTLVYFHAAARKEMRRGVMPGRVQAVSCEEAGIVLQLEDGTVLRLSPQPRGSLRIDEAGYLPFKARTLKALPRGFLAVGADGSLLAGAIGDFRPGRRGVYETSIAVQ